jgi:hypothetical protein
LARFAAQQVACHSSQMLATLGLRARLEQAFPLQTYERVS